VYASKAFADANGGGSYYEDGIITFVERVKDAKKKKQNPPFDVTLVREEIDKFIEQHGRPYLHIRHRLLLVPYVDAPFQRFLWHFFALPHTTKSISVSGLIRFQREFAVANGIPEITSRQKILQNVSNFSQRLQPVKTGNKITRWIWQ